MKFVATATIGYDHIDGAALRQLGIEWSSAPGCNALGVAQYLASLLTAFDNRPLAGRVLGVIGVGNVGRRVAEVGHALGMTVLLNDPPRAEREGDAGFSTLDELLERADFLTLHVPLVRDGKFPTFHLADAAFLKRMKPGAALINASRGAVADNAALKAALLRHTIGGAALDVWENEPEIDRELLSLVRFGTPHIAGYSTDGKANGTGMAVRAAARFFHWDALRDFQPSGLPAPAHPEIELADSLSDADAIRRACRLCYDIEFDDRALRAAPEKFEYLRGNYRVRRENSAISVYGRVPAALPRLGFAVSGFRWSDARLEIARSARRELHLVCRSEEPVAGALTALPGIERVRIHRETSGASDFLYLPADGKFTLNFRPGETVSLETVTAVPAANS